MAVPWPYVASGYTAYLVETLTTRLSLAVWLIDAVTGEGRVGGVRVTIPVARREAIRNPSGYYVFTDLAGGTVTVVIESDDYFPAESTVDLSLLDLLHPVVEVVLNPLPSYPFPPNATLVRGIAGVVPVEGAVVTVVGKTVAGRTDRNGEFVLAFRGIKTENITIEITEGGTTKSVPATIEEGRTASLGVVAFP